ncbi:glycosyltransferase family 4 protein [Qipengyuania spongiae]|uniref:Glycosyltransferase family 4 protein n=1 Tax=Qipengyuania spongiae TaxID=2909673 RepID=A0ABY5T595_9SPHN|nr:glycosyltransferase family 4 protein [Qipengyuania spongiae]UVI40794.1 glycosyltransferase family 4 protein [Qipengyuania spongiae]
MPDQPSLSVGIVAWTYPPEKSGLAVAAREIAQSLAEQGHDVRVLTLDRYGRAMDGSVEVVGAADALTPALEIIRKCPAIGHLAAPLAFRRTIRHEHRRRPFDVIEGTNWYAPLALAAEPGIPLVTRCSSPVAETLEQPDTLRNRLDGMVARWLEAASARGSAGLISNSREHGRKIAALYEAPTPPCAEHALIGLSLAPEFLARARCARFPDPASERIEVLFVGRPELRKGFDAVARATQLLQDQPVDFRLVGVTREDVETATGAPAGASWHCHHRLDQDDLLAAFEGAHVVLCPSRYESFGLVYQEALAFGRVVIACAEDPSAREFVGETDGGMLVGSCEGSAIADMLAKLLADRSLLSTWRDKALAASGRFDRSSLAKQTVAAYRNAIQRSGIGSRSAASS